MGDMKQFPTGNFPAVYMREKEHGEDSLVNTTVEGNTIVVHGTYPFLVIRQDNNVVGLRRNTKK
jgi:type IV secretion system protein VirB9